MPDSRQEGRGRIIECSPEALRAIHDAVMAGYFQFVRGGLEVGGVMFGRLDGETLHILASRPIPAAYHHGHDFSIASSERRILSVVLQAPAKEPPLRGLMAAGWYRSNTHGGLELSEKDAALHAEWFPEPWQVALVLRPEWKKPTRAAFYVRDAGGVLRQAPEFVVDPDGGVHRTVVAAAGAPEWKADEARPAEPESTLAAPAAEEEREHIESAGSVLLRDYGGKKPRVRKFWWWLAVVILAAGAIGYGIRHEWFVGPLRLHLTLKDTGGWLSVQWDRESPAIRWAEEATLEIRDGDQRRVLRLSAAELRGPEIVVGRSTGRVEATLRVRLAGGRTAEGRATLDAQGAARSPSEAR